MSFLSIFALLCALAASQWIADAVKSSMPEHSPSTWFKVVLVHYLLILGWVFLHDPGSVGDALRHAATLTFCVRWFYFMKRLKAG